MLVEVGVGVLERVEPVLERHEDPDVVGRLRPGHVGPDVRGEVAAGAGVQRRLERDRHRERPHGLALALLLEATVSTRSWIPACTSCEATIAVDPPTEPAVCTRNSGLPAAPRASARYSSGIITPSKKSGALPMTTASMSRPGHLGVGEGAGGGLAHEPGHRDVAPRGLVLGLADPDDGDPVLAHQRLPFQDDDEVLLQARARRWRGRRPRVASPSMIRWATSPMRVRPATITGLAASAPPDGLTLPWSPQPERVAQDQLLGAERGVQLGDVERRRRPRPSRRAGRWTPTSVRSRTPRAIGSMRWSMPRIHAGRSRSSRARSPAARITAQAPSVIGGQSCLRSGSTIERLVEVLLDRAVPRQLGVRVVQGVAGGCGWRPRRSPPRWPCPRRAAPGPAGRRG